MTESVELPPSWATGTTPGIHDFPNERPLPPMDWKDLSRRIRFMLDTFLGNVAKAFGAIEIFGWKPFDFLAQWGQERIDEANRAYQAALGAQSSANYANAQLLGLTNSGLASDVPGGVSVTETFNGAEASTLGANFTRRSINGGGGGFGPDGAGAAVWKRSGGLSRGHFDRHITPLATRYQVIVCVMSSKVQAPFLGGTSYTMLRARVSVDDLTFVYALFNHEELEVGCYVANSKTVFATVDVPWVDGDVVHLLAGTDTDDREFIVKRNGQTIWQGIDGAAVSMVDDTDYLHIGMTSFAADRGRKVGSFNFFNDTQTLPAGLDILSAADRLPTSI